MRPSRSPMGSTPAQVTSPAAISVSSPAGSYPATRAGRMEVSSSDAGNGRALQAFDGVEQRIEMRMGTAPRRQQPLPVGKEAGQRVLLDRLDFAAQLGQGFAANLAQDLGVAPLAMQAARAKTAFEDTTLHQELAQCVFDYGGIEGKAIGDFAQRERPVGACVAANQFEHRLRHGIDERGGRPGGSGMPSASR